MRSSTSTIASRRIKLHNVKTILGKAGNPELPPDSVDAVLLLKTYHEVASAGGIVAQPAQLTAAGRARRHHRSRRQRHNHGVHKEIVLHEAGEAGYRLLEEHDNLVVDDDMDYFLVLQVK